MGGFLRHFDSSTKLTAGKLRASNRDFLSWGFENWSFGMVVFFSRWQYHIARIGREFVRGCGESMSE